MARGKLAELFYDLRASTEGLGRDLKEAEGQFGKLEKYVLEHPYMAIGALSAAVLGVGVAATKMAAEVEKGLRQVEARVPTTAAEMTRLRDTIRDISLSGPRGQAELASAAAEIARQGAGSIEDVQLRLRAVTKIADATGEDLTGVIQGLDQAMDMFGLSSNEADGFLAKLYATAANRMPITELFGAFQTAAPAVRDFGLDADTTMRALGALLDSGMNAKQAGSELKAYGALGKEGATEIRKLADSYKVAADAGARLDAAQRKMNESEEALAARVKNNLNTQLIDLGNKILPVVTQGLEGVVALLDHFNGQLERIKGYSEVATIITGFSASGKGLSANAFKNQVMHAAELARNGNLDLGGLSVAQLDRMAVNITAVAKQTQTAEVYFGDLTRAIAAARAEAAKLAETSGKSAGAAGGTAGRGGVRTADQVKADQDAAKKKAEDFAKLIERSAKIASDGIDEFEKKVAEGSDTFWKDYRARLSTVTASIVEITRKAFVDMRAEAARGLVVLPAEFNEVERQAIAAAEGIRDAEVALDRLAQAQARGHEATAGDLSALEASARRLTALRATATPGSDNWKQVGDELKKVNEAITKILGGVADAGKGLETPIRKTTDALISQARALQQSVDGALQLAEAFGLVDENVASSLRAVAQFAANIPALTNAWAKRNDTGKDSAGNMIGGFGNLVGAALPVAGAVASLVGGFVSAAKAAREHAEALRAARTKLSENLRDRNAGMGLNDTQQRVAEIDRQRKDDVAAMLDLLIQQKGVNVGTRTDFLAKDQAGQRAVLTNALAAADHAGVREALRAAIEQFDLLAESALKAKAALEAELVEKRRDIDQSLAERRLKLAGRTDEVDALAFAAGQEKELADARAGGVYTAEQLVELQSILNDEQQKYLADQKKRLDDEAAAKAREAAQNKEDLQTRINAADGETPAERQRRVAIEHERELLDWMAKGADAATLALVKLAQAADDAAAAQAAAMAAQREAQDLDVELLQLQGKTKEAADKEFELAQQRRWDDAVAAGKSPEVLAKLAAVIAAARAQRARDATAPVGDAAAPEGAAGAGGGATSASGTGIATATIVQTDRLLGLVGTLVAYERQELDLFKDFIAAVLVARPPLTPPALPSSFTVGQGGQLIQVRVQLTQNFYGSVGGGREGAAALGQLSLDAIETGLANNALLSAQGRGLVTR